MNKHHQSMRNWHLMVNNATPADNKIKTPIVPPTNSEDNNETSNEEYVSPVEETTVQSEETTIQNEDTKEITKEKHRGRPKYQTPDNNE